MPGVPVNSVLVNLGSLIYLLVTLYIWMVIARVLLTWISPNPHSPLMRFLSRTVDPALALAHRVCPLTLGGLNFSPVLLIIVLQLLGTFFDDGFHYLGYGFSPAALLPILAKTLVGLLASIGWLLVVLMIVRIVMSLVGPAPYNPLVMVVYGLTEPLLAPLRRVVSQGSRGLDLRALIFIAIVVLIEIVVIGRLFMLLELWLRGLAPALA